MSSKAWMPFYVGDYLGDTLHLTTLQHGMYLLLICHYWQRGCLPTDRQSLAKISRVSMYLWNQNKATISAFFSHPGWRHKRIDEELARYEKIRRTRQLAGTIGGTKSQITRHWRLNTIEANARSRKQAYALPSTEERKKEEEAGEQGRKQEPDWREAARELARPSRRNGWEK